MQSAQLAPLPSRQAPAEAQGLTPALGGAGGGGGSLGALLVMLRCTLLGKEEGRVTSPQASGLSGSDPLSVPGERGRMETVAYSPPPPLRDELACCSAL